MLDWWRWSLRLAAMVALIAAGIFLALHPSATYYPPAGAQRTALTLNCFSPFDRFTRDSGGESGVPFVPHRPQRSYLST